MVLVALVLVSTLVLVGGVEATLNTGLATSVGSLKTDGGGSRGSGGRSRSGSTTVSVTGVVVTSVVVVVSSVSSVVVATSGLTVIGNGELFSIETIFSDKLEPEKTGKDVRRSCHRGNRVERQRREQVDG